MIDVNKKQDEYEALGIFPDTWACIANLPKRDAMKYAFMVAASGCPVRIAKDPDGKRWHVAVQGGLKSNPVAWIVGVRGDPFEPVTCIDLSAQHPQVLEREASAEAGNGS